MIETRINIDKVALSSIIRAMERSPSIVDSRFVSRGKLVVGNTMTEYWRDNIYKFYNRRTLEGLPVSGKLGNALGVEFDSKAMVLFLKDIWHHTRGGSYEYSQYLIRNIQPSPGKYVRVLDRRVKTGMHPGARNLSTWEAVQSVMHTVAHGLCLTEMNKAVEKYFASFNVSIQKDPDISRMSGPSHGTLGTSRGSSFRSSNDTSPASSISKAHEDTTRHVERKANLKTSDKLGIRFIQSESRKQSAPIPKVNDNDVLERIKRGALQAGKKSSEYSNRRKEY